ncbi:MAG: S24 family peptidase, partial [Thermaurantiacus sp.]
MTEKPLFDIVHLRTVLETATGPGSKWNARSLSLAASAGKSPHLVRDIIRGKSANPQLETVLGLAKALEMDIAQLVPSTATLMPRVGMTGGLEQLEVVGAVAAGVWREQTDWAAEDRYSIEVGPNPVAGGERFALRMEGHSMDKIIPPGSDLECLRVSFGLVEPQPGDIVIVQAADATALVPIRSGAAAGEGVTVDGCGSAPALLRSASLPFSIAVEATAVP